MKPIINEILNQRIFLEKPPVLADVGASYHIYPLWEAIAPYSICLAFDPDLREMAYLEEQASGFKQLYKFPNIVSDQSKLEKFYLTESPYCSSSLEPYFGALEGWEFQNMFKVIEETSLRSTTLSAVMMELNLSYLDWIKLDTQGTDLRIFKSLDLQIQDQVLAVDFEPGIVDAYKGEDKLYHVLEYMDKKDFWVSDLDVKGVRRSSVKYNADEDITNLRTSPCWAETRFIKCNCTTERDMFLLWIFATISEQNGYALEVAKAGFQKFENELFQDCANSSREAMKPKKRTLRQKLISFAIFKLRKWQS